MFCEEDIGPLVMGVSRVVLAKLSVLILFEGVKSRERPGWILSFTDDVVRSLLI